YQMPDGETLLDNFRLELSSYPDISATLTIKRSSGTETLSQAGSDRTGGILITSKRTYHEATLFGFDENPHAMKLFGELRCDGIYDLQAAGDPIVDKNRDGLRKDHALRKEIFEAAREQVSKIVESEKEKEKQKKKSLEKEETLRRFKDAIRNLNQIAKKELQIG